MKEETKSIVLSISKRVGFLILELWLLMTFLFILFRLAPGDPIYLLFPKGATPEVVESWKEILGYDKPLFVQYLIYLANTFTGDFGISFKYAPTTSISRILPPYILKTFFLLVVSLSLSIIFGYMLGKRTARKKGKIFDKITTSFGIFIFAVPAFISSLFFILIFANLFPGWPFWGAVSENFGDFSIFEKIADILQHALVPLLVLTLTGFSMYMLMVRNRSINSLPKVIFSFPWTIPILFGWLIANEILIEYIFTYKGIGYLLWEGLLGYDWPLMLAVTFILIFFVLFATFIVDILIILFKTLPSFKIDENDDRQQTSSNQNSHLQKPNNESLFSRNWFLKIWQEYKKSIFGVIGLYILIAIFIIALIGPFIAPENPTIPKDPESIMPQPPSLRYIFGTDYEDKDILSQFLWGARDPVSIVIITVLSSVIFGSIVGIYLNKIRKYGFFGKIAYIISERMIFILSIIPIFMLLFITVLFLGRFSLNNLFVIALFIWMPVVLIVQRVTNEDEKAGYSLNLKESIARAIPSALFITKFLVIISIISVSMLYFFCLGSPNTVSWGWMLERAHSENAFLNFYWWWIFPPFIGLTLLGVSSYLVLDRLEKVFDYRIERRN